MSAADIWDDEAFVRLMRDVIAEPEMTHELAAQEAMADHRTEKQSERMGLWEQQL